MNKTLLTLLSSLIIGCSTVPDYNQTDEYKFRYMLETPTQGGVIHEFDTDHDGYGDLRFIYKTVRRYADHWGDNDVYALELFAIQNDKNRNRVFDKDEIIYLNEAGNKI